MTRHQPRSAVRAVLAWAGLLAAQSLWGCDPSLAVPDPNRVPLAQARVLGQEGQNVTIDYTGMPVRVTLDASQSSDPDGTIKTYRWLSGVPAEPSAPAAGSGAAGSAAGAGGTSGDDDDAGTAGGPAAGASGTAGGPAAGASGMPAAGSSGSGRWAPAGQPPDWPADERQPVVELDEGEYTFVLWVIDDKNAVSDPSYLEVTVQRPLDPAVEACVETVLDTVPVACKACICAIDDACRTAVNETMCGADCWGLIRCIGERCPDRANACIGSMCSSFLSGASGATPVGPCVTTCIDSCRSGG